jgi:hypothetical protein
MFSQCCAQPVPSKWSPAGPSGSSGNDAQRLLPAASSPSSSLRESHNGGGRELRPVRNPSPSPSVGAAPSASPSVPLQVPQCPELFPEQQPELICSPSVAE